MRLSNMAAAGLALMVAGVAHGQYQWRAVPLHPDGMSSSEARAAHGGRQAGWINPGIPDPVRPTIWEGSADSWIDLTPPWALGGIINGMDGGSQVGQVAPVPNTFHAALWHGTPESAVNLNPSGYRSSEAFGVSGKVQVGIVDTFDSVLPRAAMWRGSAESFVDLHPAGAGRSLAFATDGVLQGGVASLPGGADLEAVIWAGSADTVVDLTPQGAQRAEVRAMAPGVQVGNVKYPFENPRAALWRGSADTFVDLSPPGSAWSELHGTDGTVHVGGAWFGGRSNAFVWLDGPEGVNLHPLLPAQFFSSTATGVFRDGDTIFVTGIGSRGPQEAWLWIGVIPAPGTAIGLLLGVGLLSNRRRCR